MSAERTPLTTGEAIGGQVLVKPATPNQLVLECKLKDCDATLRLMTHSGIKDGVRRWTQLSAEVLLSPAKPKRGRFASSQQYPARITWSIADLSACHVSHFDSQDTIWIGTASFDRDPKEAARVMEFLVALGVRIIDYTKGSGS